MTIKYQNHEFKGTAGEWYQDEYGNVKAQKTCASMNMVPFSGLCLTGGEEAKANSVLAKSAPKLLQALIDIVGLNEKGYLVDGGPAHDKAVAAILQAMGAEK